MDWDDGGVCGASWEADSGVNGEIKFRGGRMLLIILNLVSAYHRNSLGWANRGLKYNDIVSALTTAECSKKRMFSVAGI